MNIYKARVAYWRERENSVVNREDNDDDDLIIDENERRFGDDTA